MTPAKWLFQALVADIDPKRALADLIDNSLDHWEEGGKGERLEIQIVISEKQQVFSLEDNAGGLARNELPLLFRPGGTNRIGAKKARGVYGLGSKRAMFALGREVEVTTHAADERGYRIKIPEDWFSGDVHSTVWRLEYETDDSIPVGSTKIVVSKPRIRLTSYFIKGIKKFLRTTYHDFVEDDQVEFWVNGEHLEVFPGVQWAKSEYAPPVCINSKLEVPAVGRSVEVTLCVGVMVAPGERMEYGFDLICNGREVLEHVTDYRLGFSQDYLGNPHQTINRFRGVIKLSGDARDIPWNSSKTDLDMNHPLYRPLYNLVVGVSRQYTSFLRANYSYTRRLFGQRATVDDIYTIDLEPNDPLPKLVKRYKKEPSIKSVQYTVPIEDLLEVAEYLGNKKMSARQIGEKTFYHYLEQVVRNE